MKLKLTIVAMLLAFASSLALAGYVQPAPVGITIDSFGGVFVGGDMLTARDDDTRDESAGDDDSNDDVFIGCGTRTFDDGAGGSFRTMFCQARGLQLDPNTGEPLDPEVVVRAFCSTDNPAVIAGFTGVNDSSYLTFSYNESDQICTRIGVSSQSFYLPKTNGNKPQS